MEATLERTQNASSEPTQTKTGHGRETGIIEEIAGMLKNLAFSPCL